MVESDFILIMLAAPWKQELAAEMQEVPCH